MHDRANQVQSATYEDEIAEARLRIALNCAANGGVPGAEQMLTIGSGFRADESFQAEADEIVARCREFMGRLQHWLKNSDPGSNELTVAPRIEAISRALTGADEGRYMAGQMTALWTRMRTEALS